MELYGSEHARGLIAKILAFGSPCIGDRMDKLKSGTVVILLIWAVVLVLKIIGVLAWSWALVILLPIVLWLILVMVILAMLFFGALFLLIVAAIFSD